MELDMEKLVEAQVRRELEAIDLRSIVQAQIIAEIKDVFKQTVAPKCKEVAGARIEAEIEKCLDGEVHTDDGWGKRKQYSSFEDLFKATLKERLDGTWEMKQTITRLVEKRCASLIKQEYDKVCDKALEEYYKVRDKAWDEARERKTESCDDVNEE